MDDKLYQQHKKLPQRRQARVFCRPIRIDSSLCALHMCYICFPRRSMLLDCCSLVRTIPDLLQIHKLSDHSTLSQMLLAFQFSLSHSAHFRSRNRAGAPQLLQLHQDRCLLHLCMTNYQSFACQILTVPKSFRCYNANRIQYGLFRH